jgi:hypothetical protein
MNIKYFKFYFFLFLISFSYSNLFAKFDLEEDIEAKKEAISTTFFYMGGFNLVPSIETIGKKNLFFSSALNIFSAKSDLKKENFSLSNFNFNYGILDNFDIGFNFSAASLSDDVIASKQGMKTFLNLKYIFIKDYFKNKFINNNYLGVGAIIALSDDKNISVDNAYKYTDISSILAYFPIIEENMVMKKGKIDPYIVYGNKDGKNWDSLCAFYKISDYFNFGIGLKKNYKLNNNLRLDTIFDYQEFLYNKRENFYYDKSTYSGSIRFSYKSKYYIKIGIIKSLVDIVDNSKENKINILGFQTDISIIF